MKSGLNWIIELFPQTADCASYVAVSAKLPLFSTTSHFVTIFTALVATPATELAFLVTCSAVVLLLALRVR